MKRNITNSLIKWKNCNGRLPLLVRGARQVGKTYVITQFGEQHFRYFININFELEPIYKKCFDNLKPADILKAIASINNIPLIPGETLLFFDEIQECKQAIMSLRYFKEMLPELHVIGAGSLLEFVLRKENMRMPVGRVESLYMKPLSFSEFLAAGNYTELSHYFTSVSITDKINEAIFEKAEHLLREYFVTGGMPAVVSHYFEYNDLERCQALQAAILNSYRDDFAKYAVGSSFKYLQRIFDRAPAMVGQHFKYSIIDPHMRSRDLKPALADLVDAGLIYQVYLTRANGLPLNMDINEKKFKLLFLDTGLVKHKSLLHPELMLRKDLMLINRGVLAEQFVGQEILCHFPDYLPAELYYWERDKATAQAEVDYVIHFDDQIVPVEVKSGKTGSLRSIQVFRERKKTKFGVRISLHNLSFEKNILSVPMFMIAELPRLLRLI